MPNFPEGHHAPFDYKKLLSFTDLSNALKDIRSDIETALDAIDNADKTRGLNDHMRASMILSGLEIKMSNFAQHMREKFLK